MGGGESFFGERERERETIEMEFESVDKEIG